MDSLPHSPLDRVSNEIKSLVNVTIVVTGCRAIDAPCTATAGLLGSRLSVVPSIVTGLPPGIRVVSRPIMMWLVRLAVCNCSLKVKAAGVAMV